MKKLLSLLFAAMMVLTFSFATLAEDKPATDKAASTDTKKKSSTKKHSDKKKHDDKKKAEEDAAKAKGTKK